MSLGHNFIQSLYNLYGKDGARGSVGEEKKTIITDRTLSLKLSPFDNWNLFRGFEWVLKARISRDGDIVIIICLRFSAANAVATVYISRLAGQLYVVSNWPPRATKMVMECGPPENLCIDRSAILWSQASASSAVGTQRSPSSTSTSFAAYALLPSAALTDWLAAVRHSSINNVMHASDDNGVPMAECMRASEAAIIIISIELAKWICILGGCGYVIPGDGLTWPISYATIPCAQVWRTQNGSAGLNA